MKKIKEILAQLFCTKIGLLLISMLLALGFGLLSTYYDWAWWAMYASLIYPVVLFLIMITYGFIINPYREYKEYKKLRDDK